MSTAITNADAPVVTEVVASDSFREFTLDRLSHWMHAYGNERNDRPDLPISEFMERTELTTGNRHE